MFITINDLQKGMIHDLNRVIYSDTLPIEKNVKNLQSAIKEYFNREIDEKPLLDLINKQIKNESYFVNELSQLISQL